MPPALFLFLKIAWAIQAMEPLWFHENFRISCSLKKKKLVCRCLCVRDQLEKYKLKVFSDLRKACTLDMSGDFLNFPVCATNP